MSIRNKLRKLRRMSGREVAGRVRDVVRRRSERRVWRKKESQDNGRFDTDNLLAAASLLVPGCGVVGSTPVSPASSIDAAECIATGRWKMLGHEFDLAGSIDWHKDPRSEFRWSRSFYADLPTSDLPDGVDVKYVWELGRQQYVVELARGWLLDGEERFAIRARDLILHWIEHNPLYEGIHWTSPLEPAMRAISWIWALAMLADWNGWREGNLDKIGAALADHATYLEHHFEFYSSPYNHLMGEAAALYLLGYVFDSHPQASRWRRYARKVLLEQGPPQFYDDGFCVEQATGYHYYTLGFLAMAVAAGRTANEPLTELEPFVHKAFSAGLAFRQPNGRWPAIGDIDSARSIPVHHDDFWNFDSLCNLAAVLFDDPTLKIEESGPGDELFWLLGSDGVSQWQRLESTQLSSIEFLLPESGYAIAGDKSDWVLFDAGPVAGGLFPDSTPSTAHGHADTMQVLYSADGQPVLQDGGMPFYNGDTEWIHHFRSPAAHNTLEIEGCEFVRPVGRLGWSHEAPKPILSATSNGNAWFAGGRAEWTGVKWERHLLHIAGEGLWIADWIHADEKRSVHWYWQLPSIDEPRGKNETDESVEFEFGDFGISAKSTCAEIEAWLQNAKMPRPEGWSCPGYGEREPGSRLVVQQFVTGTALLLTNIGHTEQSIEVAVEDDAVRIGAQSTNFDQLSTATSGRLTWTIGNSAPLATVDHRQTAIVTS